MTRPHNCTGDDATCPVCAAAIDRAEDRRDEREPDSGFDPDWHYPRDLAPKGQW